MLLQPRYLHREPAITLWHLIHKFYQLTTEEMALLGKAYMYSVVMHTNKRRKSGESFYRHDCRCAIRTALARAPIKLVIVMLIHEFIEDDGWTFERVKEEFGEEIAIIVDALSKRPMDQFPDGRQDRVKSHLAMIEAVTPQYPLVIVAKADDRLDNTTDTSCLDVESRDRLFKETEGDFLPLFYRMMGFVPEELQFFYLWCLQEIEFACDNYWRSPTPA